MEADRAALREALLQAGLLLPVGEHKSNNEEMDEMAAKRHELKQRKDKKR